MFTSFKFGFFNQLLIPSNFFKVPEYLQISTKESLNIPVISKFLLKHSPCILRSSTKSESSASAIGSGQSLSIKNLFTLEGVNKALEKIFDQPDLLEVCLQKQIEWDMHYTASYSQECFFVEKSNFSFKEDPRNLKNFCFFTKNTFLGEIEYKKAIMLSLLRLQTLLKFSSIIFELGVKDSKVYVFQAIGVDKKFLKSYYKNAAPLIKQTLFLDKHYSAFHIIKMSFQSVYYNWFSRFYGKQGMKAVLYNWSFILFYFYLFTVKHKKAETAKTFVKFLSIVQKKKNTFSKLTHKHIVRANQISSGKGLGAGFLENIISEEETFLYLGSGEFKGVVNKNIFILPYLDPKIIIKYKNYGKPICILTSDYSLLSHGFLMATEYDIFVVAAIKVDVLKELKVKKNILINFEKNKLLY